MNIYFFDHGIEKNRAEILKSLRHAIQDQMPGAEIDAVLSLAYDRDNQFFLRSSSGIIWGRVFYETLSHANIQTLRKEIDHLLQTFRQKLLLYVFSPSIFSEVSRLIEKLPGAPAFFEYSFLGSAHGRALALRERIFSPGKKEVSTPPVSSPKPEAYRFFKHARLTRDELADLIELGLELKKLA